MPPQAVRGLRQRKQREAIKASSRPQRQRRLRLVAEWPVSDDGDNSNCSLLRNVLIWSNKTLVPCIAYAKEPFSLLEKHVPVFSRAP